MANKIKINVFELEMEAELDDSQTARQIWEILPLEGKTHRWGEEIYFSIPLSLPPEDPKEVVEEGDLGFWPAGGSFCIFFGPTPVSKGDEIRPIGPVNVFGKILGDAKEFSRVTDEEKIRIDREFGSD